MKNSILIALVILFFSCKKEEKTYAPVQSSLELTVNGLKADKAEVAQVLEATSGNQKVLAVRIIFNDTGTLFFRFPLISGRDLDAADGMYMELSIAGMGPVTSTQRLRLSGFFDNSRFTSFSGSCNMETYDVFKPAIKTSVSCTFNNLLYEK